MEYRRVIPAALLAALLGEDSTWLRNIADPTVFWLHGFGVGASFLAIGEEESLVLNADENPFAQVDQFVAHQWTFACLSYDLKNAVEKLSSRDEDPLAIPDLVLVRPKWVLKVHGGLVSVCKSPTGEETFPWEEKEALQIPAVQLQPRIERSRYLSDLDKVLKHIQRGDIYEINYCQEFFAEGVDLNPEAVFDRLNKRAKAPFSAFVKWRGKYALCASPERFFKKKGAAIISQPIKGTAARKADPKADLASAQSLLDSDKEKSENVMITDLVRNDLSRIAARGSVGVDELFGIYTFPTVHQMISTVRATIKEGTTWKSLFEALFPMGSMTGAPKISAMQIAEQLEAHRRGLYSGSIGYIDPDGDADFNVVIRSFLYNSATGYLSASAGGAITIASDPEKEYEESLLKLEALFDVLS